MDAPYHDTPVAATRVGLVMAAVRARIDARAIGRGAKLPSVRKFAEQLGVSKSTVVEAYDRLAAEGIHTFVGNVYTAAILFRRSQSLGRALPAL